MGLRNIVIEYILDGVTKTHLEYRGKSLKMCELGNQHLRTPGNAAKQFNTKQVSTGKQFFTELGFNHVSIDTNGLDGALKIDLTIRIGDRNLIGSFDVLTNSGTSEHVKDQYACFENIHNLLKVGGVAIHVVPHTKCWPNHGLVWYDQDFFIELASKAGYTVIDAGVIDKGTWVANACAVLLKTSGDAFIDRKTFETLRLHTS